MDEFWCDWNFGFMSHCCFQHWGHLCRMLFWFSICAWSLSCLFRCWIKKMSSVGHSLSISLFLFLTVIFIAAARLGHFLDLHVWPHDPSFAALAWMISKCALNNITVVKCDALSWKIWKIWRKVEKRREITPISPCTLWTSKHTLWLIARLAALEIFVCRMETQSLMTRQRVRDTWVVVPRSPGSIGTITDQRQCWAHRLVAISWRSAAWLLQLRRRFWGITSEWIFKKTLSELLGMHPNVPLAMAVCILLLNPVLVCFPAQEWLHPTITPFVPSCVVPLLLGPWQTERLDVCLAACSALHCYCLTSSGVHYSYETFW